MFQLVADYFQDDIDFETDGDSTTLSSPLAFCPETGRIIFVTCSLMLAFDENIFPGFFHEIGFEVDVISIDQTRENVATRDRNIACNFIPIELRATGMSIVRDNYTRLIQKVRPNTIYRVVNFPGNIPAAMSKHDSLTTMIEDLGYVVTYSDFDTFRRWYWLMGRLQRQG